MAATTGSRGMLIEDPSEGSLPGHVRVRRGPDPVPRAASSSGTKRAASPTHGAGATRRRRMIPKTSNRCRTRSQKKHRSRSSTLRPAQFAWDEVVGRRDSNVSRPRCAQGAPSSCSPWSCSGRKRSAGSRGREPGARAISHRRRRRIVSGQRSSRGTWPSCLNSASPWSRRDEAALRGARSTSLI